MSTRGDFVKFFFLMYLANMAASGAGYSLFYLAKSLKLMQASNGFTLLALDIARLTTVVCMLLLRKHSDYISKQKMSLIGAGLTFLAFLGLTFSNGSVWILLFCVLFGISAATPAYLGAIMFDRTAPEQRMKIFGYFATSYSLSSLLGAFLTETLYPIGVHGQTDGFITMDTWGFLNPLRMGVDINPSFIMLSGVLLAILWVITTLWAKTLEKKLPFFGVATLQERDYKPPFLEYKTPMGLTLLLGIIWMSLMSLIPSYCIYLGVERSALFFTGFGILAVFGRFFILPHTEKLGRRRIVYLSFLSYIFSFLSVLLLPYYPVPTLLLFAGMACGLGHGILYTVLNIVFTEVTPKHTGNATFVFTISFQVGCLLVLPVGVLVDLLGYSAVFWLILLLAVLVLGFSFARPELQKSLQASPKKS